MNPVSCGTNVGTSRVLQTGYANSFAGVASLQKESGWVIAAVRWVGELLDELVSGSAVSVRVSPDIRKPSDWLAWRLIPEAFAGLRVPRHTQLGKCCAPVSNRQFSVVFCMW